VVNPISIVANQAILSPDSDVAVPCEDVPDFSVSDLMFVT
jgi:hypothetical protein